jgi:hypothetical protein
MRALLKLFGSWQMEQCPAALGSFMSEPSICWRLAETITGSVKLSFAPGMLKVIRVAAALRIAMLLL